MLLIRRGIEPRKGYLAFPGGFLETGDTWQSGAARELSEEAGVLVDHEKVSEVTANCGPFRISL